MIISSTIIFKLYQNYEPDYNNLVIILVSYLFLSKLYKCILITSFCALHLIILKHKMSVVQNLVDLKPGTHNVSKILVIINRQ